MTNLEIRALMIRALQQAAEQVAANLKDAGVTLTEDRLEEIVDMTNPEDEFLDALLENGVVPF